MNGINNGTMNANATNEWQTAGKSKPNKSMKSGSAQRPERVQSPVSKDQSGVAINGYAHVEPTMAQNGTGPKNGYISNGFYGSGRRGRQSNGYYNDRSRQQNPVYSAQSAKSSVNGKEDALSKRKLVEKEAKNLAKYDAATERTARLFQEEIQKSQDRLRRAFEEMRHHLAEREKTMADELERCKEEGSASLEQGKERAKELRTETERVPTMNDRQVNDLRDQIKRFLAERRFEDDLSRTIRFQFEPDRLIDMVKSFGQVVPINRHGPNNHSNQISVANNSEEIDPASGGSEKAITEISLGGICMKSESMSADQLVQLTQHLQENLKLQGISEDILPDVTGITGVMPARRRPAPVRFDNQNGYYNHNQNRGRGGYHRRGNRGGGGGGGGGRQGYGAETTRY